MHHLDGLAAVEPDLAQRNFRPAVKPQQAAHDKEHRDDLRDDRRDGDAGDVDLADDDEEQIQQRVDHAGDRQIDQRAARVAVGAENGRAEVVDQREGHAEEVELQIERRFFEDVRRRLHPFEHRAAEEQADGHDKQPEQRTERDGAVARAGDAVRVMTADAARDQNVHADRDADEGVDDEIDERGRRADSGERNAP